jgi:hypothetical protein
MKVDDGSRSSYYCWATPMFDSPSGRGRRE